MPALLICVHWINSRVFWLSVFLSKNKLRLHEYLYQQFHYWILISAWHFSQLTARERVISRHLQQEDIAAELANWISWGIETSIAALFTQLCPSLSVCGSTLFIRTESSVQNRDFQNPGQFFLTAKTPSECLWVKHCTREPFPLWIHPIKLSWQVAIKLR